MAGGIGSRFWPFSRSSKPKQFMDFLNTGRSLLQITFDRFSTIIPVENIYVVTNFMYRDLVAEQLPELSAHQILSEPSRRNTAPFIAYATYKIKKENPEANIVITPADHLILRESVFLKVVQQGLKFVEEKDALLTLGVKPNRPETGYGYIQVHEDDANSIEENGIYKVRTFTEKPNIDLATVFVQSGEFFWNSGVFFWSVKSIEQEFDKFLPELASKFSDGMSVYATDKEQEFINKVYSSCPNISIDYSVLEKSENVFVLCSDFGWSDLGTWTALYDVSPKDAKGNVSLKCKTQFYESSNNIVASSEPNKLVVLQGLDDYIVADSENVLLVCKREESRIRQFVTDINVKYSGEYI